MSRTWAERILLTLLLLWAGAAQAARLPAPVASALRTAHIPLADVGIVVWPVDRQRPMLALHANEAMAPASTMKLVTSLAALDLLGPAYRWQTRVYADGPIEHGTLKGNLYLVGGGDPYLTFDRLWRMLRAIRLAGVRDIDGDVVLDDSLFAPQPDDPGAFDDAPREPYNAPPSALLTNFNASWLYLRPQADTVLVQMDPQPANLTVANRLQLADGPCGDWGDGLSLQLDAGTLTLAGRYPAACGSQMQGVNLGAPLATTAGLFETLWRELGGKMAGTVHPGALAPGARPLLAWPSAPLMNVVRAMDKYSNNVMAKTIFLDLSADDPPADAAKSATRVEDWLDRLGIAHPGLVLVNGSGLSRRERVAPLTLAQLLRHAYRSPVYGELESALPILGLDGTLRHRMQDTPLAGRAHLKTGTLRNAKAIAGYVLDRNKQRVVVVFLVNANDAADAAAAQDALLRWVYRGMPAPRR